MHAENSHKKESREEHYKRRQNEQSNHHKRSRSEIKIKEEPSIKRYEKVSGKLNLDIIKFNEVVIKYNEPLQARKPKCRWRLYPFKEEELLPVLHLHQQSVFLFGYDRTIADIPIDHPSCSKQHAIFQFRMVGYKRLDGTKSHHVKPFILDLNSANGSFVNGKK